MATWQLILDPQQSGSHHMAADIKLFNDFEAGLIPPTLRIYSWQPKCISFGRAQDKEKDKNDDKVRQAGWESVMRPTGGGIVFHNEAEVTYSLVMDKDDPILPKGLVPSYKKISEAVVKALNSIGISTEIKSSPLSSPLANSFPSPLCGEGCSDVRRSGVRSLCFSFPAEYELVCNNKKIVGSAQKRGKQALLQQGSIFMSPIDEADFGLLSDREERYNAVSVSEVLGQTVDFKTMSDALVKGFSIVLHFEF